MGAIAPAVNLPRNRFPANFQVLLRHSLPLALLICSAARVPAQSPTPAAVPVAPAALVLKIQRELNGSFPPEDGKTNPGVPHGEFLHGRITDSAIYPGTDNEFSVYVPAQYDPASPACLLVKLDGLGSYEGTVLDNLIARKEVPVIIGVGVSPGRIWKDPQGTPERRAMRFNRAKDGVPRRPGNPSLHRWQRSRRDWREYRRNRLIHAGLAATGPVHPHL